MDASRAAGVPALFLLLHGIPLERIADMVKYASDGSILAWIDTRTLLHRVIGFDLETRQEFLIHEATDTGSRFSAIAVDEHMVYYTDTNRAQPGLYAYHLLTQATQQLAPGGQRVAAADGVVAWFDQQQPPYGPHTLTLLERNTQQQTTVTAQRGTPTGLSLSAGTIIWSFFPDGDDGRVFAYDTTTAISQPLSTGGGWYPVSNGPWVAWTTTESVTATVTHTITVLNRTTGESTPLVTESAGPLRMCGISADGRVLFMVYTPGAANARLYLSQPGTSGLQYSHGNDTEKPSVSPAQGANNYIYTSVREFRINRPGGSIVIWPVHGV